MGSAAWRALVVKGVNIVKARDNLPRESSVIGCENVVARTFESSETAH